ncbi:intradiol ring-cleavage dioxygenase [Streptomyces sp. NPDC056716]|uniref:intradiol ring-cleavage dioxygenase n=1 Tax=unclassified Streptomyces TaxID=2593676 RepID=UPI0036A139F0
MTQDTPHPRSSEPAPHPHGPSRRRVLLAGGAGLAVAGLTATASAPPASATDLPADCYPLATEAIEGPYYLDYDLFRRDLTEDRAGIPLDLRLTFLDVVTCKPLRGAAVDIWSCDATGVYSGYTEIGNDTPPPAGGGHVPPTDDLTYLRGSQITDRRGEVDFRTLFPGWYIGRTVHIHVKVYVGGELTPDGYESGEVCHTGQLYFAEEAVLASAEVAPYNTSTVTRTTLDVDRWYGGGGAVDGLLNLSYAQGAIERGVRGSLTLGVDPSAIPTTPAASAS